MSDITAFEALVASDSEHKIAKQAATDKLAAAIYDVREQFGAHLLCAKTKEEFSDRVALCKDDMMKTVNAHLMPVTGVMRKVCKTMEREWREKIAADEIAVAPAGPRPLHEIARDIKTNWPKVNYAAQPYLDALHELNSVDDMYYQDPASHIVNYFLSNASTWRGPEAKRIKDELKGLVKRRASRLAYSDEDLAAYAEEFGHSPVGGQHYTQPESGYAEEWHPGTKKADNTGPVQSIDQTFSPSDADLIPEGDFAGYLDSVDQNAPAQVQRDFEARLLTALDGTGGSAPVQQDAGGAAGGGGTINNSTDMMPPGFNMPDTGIGSPDVMVGAPQVAGGMPGGVVANIVKRYAQWCVDNLARPSVNTMEYYAAKRPDLEYFVLTSALQRHAASGYTDPFASAVSGTPTPAQGGLGGPGKTKKKLPGAAPTSADAVKDSLAKMRTANQRTAAPKDYLAQADEAITNLLNEKAEEFQESIQPLQQALQTIQYAQQVQQVQNPMSVTPPAGTVNVLPQGQAPQGPAPQGVDPSSGQIDPAILQQLMGQGGMDPSMGQGDPSQQSGPPPAAAAQGAVPPELAQQIQARRRQAKGKKSEDNDYGADFDRQFGGYEEGGWRDNLDSMIDSVKLRDRSKESRRRQAKGDTPLGGKPTKPDTNVYRSQDGDPWIQVPEEENWNPQHERKARRRQAMPMTEDGYVQGDGWIPGEDFDPNDPDEMEIMDHVWAKEKQDRLHQLERENEMLHGIVNKHQEGIGDDEYFQSDDDAYASAPQGGDYDDDDSPYIHEGAVSELGYDWPPTDEDEYHPDPRTKEEWQGKPKRGGHPKG